MLRFEHREEKPISTRHFVLRMLRSAAIAGLVIFSALAVGIAGYHWFGGLGWTDSFLNAAMILGGMGPVDPMPNDTAKIFAGGYALFSGLVFIALAGFFIAPIAHRVLHHFHYADDRDS